MQNYFNFYTEIEEHFQRRRGTLLMLSTLDWSLVATWQEAGFPLQAVLAGIDAAFEKYAARQTKGRVRRINGLAYCAQEVLRAVEDMHEAAVGVARIQTPSPEESGFEAARIAAYLCHAGEQLQAASVPPEMRPVLSQTVGTLGQLAASVKNDAEHKDAASIESLERSLLVLEDRLFAALHAFTPAEKLVAYREQSARELAPYRSRLGTTQIRQIEQQYLRRCLFEQYRIPRLSLFYLRQT